MRRVGNFLTVALALLVSGSVFAVVKTSAFRVEGMRDDVAVRRVTDAVKAVPGVQDAVGSKGSAILMVRYDSAVASAIDLAEAVSTTGYTLTSVEGPVQAGQGTNQKARTVLTEFAQVLGHTKEFLEKERYGVVRNLAPAMRLRRDAIVGFEKSVAPVRYSAGQVNTMQLAQTLGKDVDVFAAAAEARDKGAVRAAFPNVTKAFKALADARNFDDLLAPPITNPQGQPSKASIEQQLQDYITKALGGK